jgi:hypothetical protein
MRVPMGTPTQKLAVALAFVAAAVSLGAAALRLARDGRVDAVFAFGGLLMLVLAVGGYTRLKNAGAERKD